MACKNVGATLMVRELAMALFVSLRFTVFLRMLGAYTYA